MEKVWKEMRARRGFIGESKDFRSGPELVLKPVKMDEGWEDVLPGLRACEDCWTCWNLPKTLLQES